MTSPPTRGWFAFRLRTLILLTMVLGCALTPLAMNVKRVRDQEKAVRWVLKSGGWVQYDWQSARAAAPSGPRWLRKLLGNHFFQTVRYVAVGDRRDKDLSPLTSLSELQDLELSGKELGDLTPLQQLPGLRTLALGHSRVNDLKPLKRMSNLRGLNLENTLVNDLRPLRCLHKLECLILNGTPVRDLKPLEGMTSLREVYLRDTKATDEDVAQLRKALPNCEIVR